MFSLPSFSLLFALFMDVPLLPAPLPSFTYHIRLLSYTPHPLHDPSHPHAPVTLLHHIPLYFHPFHSLSLPVPPTPTPTPHFRFLIHLWTLFMYICLLFYIYNVYTSLA